LFYRAGQDSFQLSPDPFPLLSSVSYLFLARMRTKLRDNKSGTDDLSGERGGLGPDAELVI
ncbi:MAG TPA: hypothetical protein DDZ90_21495, partial [Planctomycetaceae bacterium]|nr:hypothetical protein [Planctomycetaceae bacterium]